MGVCLNQKFIKNLLLDKKSIDENQKLVIILNNNDDDKSKIINEKNIEKDNKIPSFIEKEPIKIPTYLDVPHKQEFKTEKLINYNIQSKYKTKFFSENLNNNSVNNNSTNIQINKENCEHLIYFTHLNEKKANAGTSTASNSNIK